MKRLSVRCASMLLLLFLSAAAVTAQDPPPPPAGFPITGLIDRQIQWSDGYRTCIDIYYPTAAAPVTGWPGVALIHGRNNTRKTTRSLSRALATQGYVTFAYDVRDQGCTSTLNPGWPKPFPRGRVLLDSAECYVVAKGLVGALLDRNRLAMTGASQGGGHSQRAAAYSERTLPLTGYVTKFPKLLAVASQINALESAENKVPGGTLLRNHVADDLSQDRNSPVWLAAAAARYDVVAAAHKANPIAYDFPLIQQSDVPILARQGYDDWRQSPDATLDYLHQLKPGVPFKGLVNGNGHGGPASNVIETAVMRDQIRRWFDRFLKGRPESITAEPLFEAAVTPVDPVTYATTTSKWQHRFSQVWPPATPPSRFYLRGNATLSTTAPPLVEGGPLLQHRVAPGFDLAKFVDDTRAGENASQVFAKIPKISRAFVGSVLANDIELFGRPTVAFNVLASAGDYQISAALFARNQQNQDRYLVGGTGAVRGQIAGNHRVSFALRDIAAIVPAGARLVLKIENLAHHNPPGQSVIEFVPWLQNVDMQLQISPAAPAVLDLPIASRVGAGLTPRLATVSAAGGFDHAMNLDAGTAMANKSYHVFLSAAGFGPGLMLGNTWAPLNLDLWTIVGVAITNTALLPDFSGMTDANGKATPRIALSTVYAPAMVGFRLTCAATLPHRDGLLVAGPAELDIRP